MAIRLNIMDQQLLPPGSPDYLKDLLAQLRDQQPGVEPRLFTAVLLCLIAGDSNLLVRTEEEDIPLVASAVADVRTDLICAAKWLF